MVTMHFVMTLSRKKNRYYKILLQDTTRRYYYKILLQDKTVILYVKTYRKVRNTWFNTFFSHFFCRGDKKLKVNPRK